MPKPLGVTAMWAMIDTDIDIGIGKGKGKDKDKDQGEPRPRMQRSTAMNTAKKTVTALAVGAALGLGAVPVIALVADPATVAALPGDPLEGCDVAPGAGACEGPARADGSRLRCSYAPAYRTGGTLIPEIKSCQVVGGHP